MTLPYDSSVGFEIADQLLCAFDEVPRNPQKILKLINKSKGHLPDQVKDRICTYLSFVIDNHRQEAGETGLSQALESLYKQSFHAGEYGVQKKIEDYLLYALKRFETEIDTSCHIEHICHLLQIYLSLNAETGDALWARVHKLASDGFQFIDHALHLFECLRDLNIRINRRRFRRMNQIVQEFRQSGIVEQLGWFKTTNSSIYKPLQHLRQHFEQAVRYEKGCNINN